VEDATADQSEEAPKKSRRTGPFVSHTGITLSRSVTFQVALDPTIEQSVLFAKCAGSRRFAFNHHVARVKENLDARTAQKLDEVEPEQMTASLSWSKFSFINEFNAWKNGRLDTSPENEDGTRGLAWRGEIPESVFECASSDAAQALKNWSDSKNGQHLGAAVGFPRYAAKGRVATSFRLRNRSQPGETQDIRFTDTSHLRLPKIGEVKVLGPTRRIRRMIDRGRFHIFSATLTQRGGRWICSLTGGGAAFHHERRNTRYRRQSSVGVDRGIIRLATVADEDGQLLAAFEGVRELRNAEAHLIRAQKTLVRTTPGSKGHARATSRVNAQHHTIANKRCYLVHQASHWLVTSCTTVVLEDLNVTGMTKNRSLAKAVSDAAMGELRRQVEYKAAWYGVDVVIADRYFPSSKLCSGCGARKDEMGLSTRTYACEHCGLEIDRDHNAGVNLARVTRSST
jgi:putative transposase